MGMVADEGFRERVSVCSEEVFVAIRAQLLEERSK